MTREADYAVRIVYSLAQSAQRCDARTLSQQTGVSLRFALKILGKLAESGLVRSFKGKKGGYELARSPGEISLRDVIETVDGPYALSRCLTAEQGCDRAGECGCGFRRVYADISKTISDRLAEVSFESFLSPGGEQTPGCISEKTNN